MSNPSTQIIDAISYDNYRAEFRLDPFKQYQNLRIINIGCILSGSNANYTDTAGVYGLIQNAYLMNGTDVLSQILDAHQLLTFNNLFQGGSKDNGLDFSLHSNFNGSSRSYKLSNYTGTTLQHVETPSLQATTFQNTTFKGWLSCSLLFNLLTQLPVIDTTLWENLRIVIEWRTNKGAIFAGDVTGIGDMTMLMPTLLADVVEMPVPLPSQVVFSQYVLEKVNLPGEAAQPGAGQLVKKDVNVRLLAFNGHRVNKLLMINVDTSRDAATDKIKTNCSEALTDERIQFTLNGVSLLPYDGCNTPQRKHHHLLGTFGMCNIAQGGHLDIANSLQSLYDDAGQIIGHQSYGGFLLHNAVIEELSLQHTHNSSPTQYKPIQLNIYGEVLMMLSIKGNQYTVAFL